MIESQFFPLLIKEIMDKEGLTLTQFAEKVGIAPGTVTNWLNTRNKPDTFSAIKLSEAFIEYKYEILKSALRWRNLSEGGFSRFVFKEAIEIIIHETQGRSTKLTNQQLSDLIKIWQKEPDHIDEKTQLIIPPQPSIVLIKNWKDVIEEISKNSSLLYQLHWKKFEDLIAHLLEKFGWSITPMGYTKDDGIDIIAIKSVVPDIAFQMMVQCKKFSEKRKVGVDIVREIWATKWEKAFHHAMVVTTSFFTKGAKQKAEAWNLELKDHHSIVKWCRKYGKIIEG